MSKQKKYLAQKFGAVDSLARIIPLRGKEEGLGVRGVASFGRGSGSSGKYAPHGYSSKMFPDFTLLGKDWISGLFSVGWATSGTVYRGEVWMLNFSDSPNVASACLLSDVLESRVHPKYFLSARAAKGILDRAERRGVKLPMALKDALTITADSKRQYPNDFITKAGKGIGQKAEQVSGQAPEVCRQILPLRRLAPTLRGFGHGWQGQHNDDVAKVGLPRRLTPTECERLQGFPDGWTRQTRLATKLSETP